MAAVTVAATGGSSHLVWVETDAARAPWELVNHIPVALGEVEHEDPILGYDSNPLNRRGTRGVTVPELDVPDLWPKVLEATDLAQLGDLDLPGRRRARDHAPSCSLCLVRQFPGRLLVLALFVQRAEVHSAELLAELKIPHV